MSGATNNSFGIIVVKTATGAVGKRITLTQTVPTHFPTARSFAANATPEQDHTEDHKKEPVKIFSSQGKRFKDFAWDDQSGKVPD